VSCAWDSARWWFKWIDCLILLLAVCNTKTEILRITRLEIPVNFSFSIAVTIFYVISQRFDSIKFTDATDRSDRAVKTASSKFSISDVFCILEVRSAMKAKSFL